MREFNIDKYGFAALGSCVFVGMLVGCLVGGWSAERFGRRVTILTAGSVLCTSGLLSAVVMDFYTFAVCRGILGMAAGVMFPVGTSLMLE